MNKKINYRKNKNTLKDITFHVTGSNEDSISFEADYQKIKRIRQLLKDSISIVDFSNLKEEYCFIAQMIEFVYNIEALEEALKKFKDTKDTNINEMNIEDYTIIVEALDNANINKKYLDKNQDLKNLYYFFKSIIEMNNQYTGMIENLSNLFQHDKEKAINFSYEYRDRVLMSTNEINIQLLSELYKINNNEKIDCKERKTVKINLGDPVEEYDDDITIMIDCNGQYVEEIDRSIYKGLENIIYVNLRDRFRENRNK